MSAMMSAKVSLDDVWPSLEAGTSKDLDSPFSPFEILLVINLVHVCLQLFCVAHSAFCIGWQLLTLRFDPSFDEVDGGVFNDGIYEALQFRL